MSLFQTLAWRIFYSICAIIFFMTVFISLYALPPGNITSVVNGGEVSLTVDRQVLLHRWQCVPVTWSVEGIEKVYFDEDAGVGQQTVTHCPTRDTHHDPLLYIDFQGEFIQTFSIPVVILTDMAWFWTAIAELILFGLFTFLPVNRVLPQTLTITMPGNMSRRRFLWVGGAAIVALAGASWVGWQRSEVTVLHDGWLLKSTEVK